MRAFFKAVAAFLSILPIAAQAQIATINGVPVSSISSVDGVPVSSIASINGLSLASGSGESSSPSVVNSQAMTGFSTTFSPSASVTAGHILVAVIYDGTGTTATVSFTHNQGGASTVMATNSLRTDEDTVAIACATITGSGTDNITFNHSDLAVVYEVANAVCANDVTPATSLSSTTTSYAAGPITTATANDILFMAGGNDGTATSAVTTGSGWTGASNGRSNSSYPLLGAYQVAASTGSYTATSGTFDS